MGPLPQRVFHRLSCQRAFHHLADVILQPGFELRQQRTLPCLPCLIALGITALLLLPLDGIELTDVPQGYIGLAGTGLALALRNGRHGLGRFDEFAPP